MFNNLSILGTSHISSQSIKQIQSHFTVSKPDIVAIELDKVRFKGLMDKKHKKTPQKPSILNQISTFGFTGFLFMTIGRYVQKKLGSVVGIEPGADMLQAAEMAQSHKSLLYLIDQPISITMKNLSKNFRFRQKCRLAWEVVSSPFKKKKQIRFDLRSIPSKDIIKQMIGYLKKQYPGLYKALIDDRNKYMAKKLFRLAKNNPNKEILCVVGAGHEEGIKYYLKQLYYSNP